MRKKIYLSPPHLSGGEINFIEDAIQSNWIAPVGPHVSEFEKELASVLQVQYAVTANSGTSALHLGLLAMGVKPGDEVICSTLTFCASVNPIIYCGAKPVLIDSEKETWNIDPVLLEEAVLHRIKVTGKKPKAIIVVHLYGMPAKMAEIVKVSQAYEIPILEDSAEALGSHYQQKPLGTLGDAGVISFNGNKIITTSGGGALVTSRSDIFETSRYLRQEAKEPLPYYEHKQIGFNYRFSNILAALGRAQLRVLNERVTAKRKIFSFYHETFSPIEQITFQPEPDRVMSNRWLTAVIIRHARTDREKIRLALLAEDIESRPVWKPMHLQPVFKDCPVYQNGVAEDLFAHGLCLPSGTTLTPEDLDRIAGIIKSRFHS